MATHVLATPTSSLAAAEDLPLEATALALVAIGDMEFVNSLPPALSAATTIVLTATRVLAMAAFGIA